MKALILASVSFVLSASAAVYPVHGGKNCPDKPCPAGEQCFIDEVQCKRAPCPSRMWCEVAKPKAEPLPDTSIVIRKSGAGSVVGGCDNKNCPNGQKCVSIEVHCVAAPCPPIQQCIDP